VGKFRYVVGVGDGGDLERRVRYVPDGVYLPRDVRLLVADTLVEQEFVIYWLGGRTRLGLLWRMRACAPPMGGNW